MGTNYLDMNYETRRGQVHSWLKSNPRVMRRLSYREREIMKLRYGLGEGVFYTLKEVGHIFKVTSARIRNIEMKALAKIDRIRIDSGENQTAK